MNKFSLVKRISILCFSLLFALSGYAQKKMESPRDSCSGKIGKATISMNYGSPSVKGRKIWGDLIPYGKVWRAGANEATTFKTDQNITVEGKALPAGTYGFFVIPGETTWTIIFNKTFKQWGAFKYDPKEDALRVDVKPAKSKSLTERLVYKINADGISLSWENIVVPVSIK